jgi:hypothetical protein
MAKLEIHLLVQAKVETRHLDEDDEATIPHYQLPCTNIADGGRTDLTVDREFFDGVNPNDTLVFELDEVLLGKGTKIGVAHE